MSFAGLSAEAPSCFGARFSVGIGVDRDDAAVLAEVAERVLDGQAQRHRVAVRILDHRGRIEAALLRRGRGLPLARAPSP